jgi:hypothetical protein
MSHACEGLKALLDGVLDYAGLFPPAKLSLPEAVRTYARCRESQQSWMLARFICPISLFANLCQLLEDLEPAEPWSISALGGRSDDAQEFDRIVSSDMQAIAEFRSPYAIVETYEVAVPGVGATNLGEVSQATTEVRSHRAARPLESYFEIGTKWGDVAVSKMIAALPDGTGAKIRTGGIEPHLFPSCEAVAHFITSCHDNGVPFKATAGLHHPIRHLDAGLGCMMHGFLNVFAGATLLRCGAIDSSLLVDLLACESADAFTFDSDGLAWNGTRATVAETIDSRPRLAVSYGSCSFDEPVDDLHNLGLL